MINLSPADIAAVGLFQQDHFPAFDEVTGFKAVDVHAAGNVAAVPHTSVFSRVHPPVYQFGHFLTHDVEDIQFHIRCVGQSKADLGNWVEGVRVVLVESESLREVLLVV